MCSEDLGKGQHNPETVVNLLLLWLVFSYDSGVILCEQYDGRLNGAKLSKMIRNKFPATLARCNNGAKLVLQDNYPVRTSKATKKAFDKIDVELFPHSYKIP